MRETIGAASYVDNKVDAAGNSIESGKKTGVRKAILAGAAGLAMTMNSLTGCAESDAKSATDVAPQTMAQPVMPKHGPEYQLGQDKNENAYSSMAIHNAISGTADYLAKHIMRIKN